MTVDTDLVASLEKDLAKAEQAGVRLMPRWVRGRHDWAGAANLRGTTACRTCSGSGRVRNHGTQNQSTHLICQACHGTGRVRS